MIVEPQNNAIHELILHINHEKKTTVLVRKHEALETQYPTESLKKGDVVLAKIKGKDVISMSCPNFEENKGGKIHVKYLHNGLTMSYKAITLELAKENETWGLYTSTPDKKQIHKLTLKPRRIAGLLIGIQSIDF